VSAYQALQTALKKLKYLGTKVTNENRQIMELRAD
jgi:hypothetical protein